MAFGERISAVSVPGQSTGLPRKPQETCHSARRSVWRRVRLVWELAERVGFEPTVQLPVLRFSRPTRSTTPAPLRCRRSFPAGVPGRGVPPYNRPLRAMQRPLTVDGRPHPALLPHSHGGASVPATLVFGQTPTSMGRRSKTTRSLKESRGDP